MAPRQRDSKSSDPRATNPDDPKVSKAFNAMKRLGISHEVVKPVLNRLLKLYDGSWELIEEDNYRTLADAIFESFDDKMKQKNKAPMVLDDQEPPPKRNDRQANLVSQRLTKLPIGQTNQIMESNNDFNQKPRNSKAEGSMSSNMNSMNNKLASQRVSSSSERKPVIIGTHDTIIQRKKHQNNDSDEDVKPLAKVTRTSVQQSGQPNQTSVRQTENKLYHKIKDITRAAEKVKISLIAEVNIELPKFVYIHENTIYQDAYAPFSLARISDNSCCLRCTGDCLSSRVPCACSRETGGEFAYTSQGLLKDEFLKACISMKSEPQSHHFFHCQDCPLERAKNVHNPEPCKGHLLKKFIKECWRKCHCSMECGNRVVQRGITCKLQVFAIEGKGWGLRTLENLPKGSFVCEYVGEILTNTELYERNTRSRSNERHTYPVYLDSDWGSEQVLKDEEALCLDATHYGNVARFINHRCFDSNLIDIPVEVETPDHHYYHIAFFTTRNIEAYEELTWDYGIDFADVDHPIKAFKCQCASSYCRDVSRQARGTKEKESGVKRLKSSTSRVT